MPTKPNEVLSFLGRCDALASLESFDPEALRANEEFSKDACDFVIALAVAHNDFNDIVYAIRLLNSVATPRQNCRSRAWGMHCGISTHLMKARAALFYEIAQLIRDNVHVLSQPGFERVVNSMPRVQRDYWTKVVKASTDPRFRNTPLGKLLGSLRDKTASHYDSATIGIEFRRRFFDRAKPGEIPIVSRGNDMLTSRFYFADALVETMVDRLEPGESMESFKQGSHPIFNQTDSAIFHLVTRFINARSNWRAFEEENSPASASKPAIAALKPKKRKSKFRRTK
jgi:hypothetical protein